MNKYIKHLLHYENAIDNLLKGDEEGAIEEFEKALSFYPDDEISLIFIGNIHDMRGDENKAIDYYLNALDGKDKPYD